MLGCSCLKPFRCRLGESILTQDLPKGTDVGGVDVGCTCCKGTLYLLLVVGILATLQTKVGNHGLEVVASGIKDPFLFLEQSLFAFFLVLDGHVFLNCNIVRKLSCVVIRKLSAIGSKELIHIIIHSLEVTLSGFVDALLLIDGPLKLGDHSVVNLLLGSALLAYGSDPEKHGNWILLNGCVVVRLSSESALHILGTVGLENET